MASWNTYKKRSFQSVFIALAVIVLINFLATKQFYRWDLTKEKRYTLTPSTKALLKDLDRQINVTVYLDGKDLPVGIKKLRNSTRELLNEFRALSGGFIDYEFVDIYKIEDEAVRKQLEENLVDVGIYPTNLNVTETSGSSKKLIYPGAVFSNDERSIGVQILENQMTFNTQDVLNNSYNFLEFKLANTVKKLLQDRQYRIGILEGNGEVNTSRITDLGQHLATQDFFIRRINLSKQTLFGESNKPDVLIIPKPTEAFSEEDKFEIDQYIMNGGKVLWMIDKVVADLDSFRAAPQFLAIERNLNLDDQLFRYGVRLNADLVQDLYCNPIPVTEDVGGGQSKTNLYPWVFHPVITMDNEHPINKNIDPVALEFVGSIDTIRVPNVEKTILLSTSDYTRISKAPVPLDLGIARVDPLPEYFQLQFVPVAVLLEGKFRSLYDNRLTKSFIQKLVEVNEDFATESSYTKQIIISDGDIGVNDIDVSGVPLPLGYNKFTKQTFANRDFLLNCIEYLLDDNGLISARNKETQMQLLDKQKVLEKKGLWQVLNIGVPLIFMFLIGGWIRWRRNKKYVI
ncbi:MAG: gliding motility-associated ABC transporter substrate-binding protein GldG [Chitinophagales bacterium]